MMTRFNIGCAGMSLRKSPSANCLLAVSSLLIGVSAGGSVLAANTSSVETYTGEVLPVTSSRYDSPLAAGTLTLQDILGTPKRKPVAAPELSAPMPPAPSAPTLNAGSKLSATGMMMSQGMKAVLQNVSPPAAPVAPMLPLEGPTPAAENASISIPDAPSATVPVPEKKQAETEPTPLVPAPSATEAPKTDEITYQPGQAPKTLGALPEAIEPSAPAASETATPAPADSSSCGQTVQRWEKTCADAGYPATFAGKITGETRTGCDDKSLHDVWVTNTCAPPETTETTPAAKINGVCGAASNKEFDEAPTDKLCGQGIAGAVTGEGPWTWACSGVNGGEPDACAAQKLVPPVDGVCGAANGAAIESAPTSDLCISGTATTVKGKGPWKWNCAGTGTGHTQSCIAPLQKHVVKKVEEPVAQTEAPTAELHERAAEPAPVEPAKKPKAVEHEAPAASFAQPSAPVASDESGELCGLAAQTMAYEAPEKNLCREGTASPVNGDGPWMWSCTNNEGLTSSCRTLSLKGEGVPEPVAPTPKAKSTVKEAVTLACGPAANAPATTKPTKGLCEGGKAGKVTGSNPWKWSCSSGKARTSCETLKVINGACGRANGMSVEAAPSSGLCAKGSASAVDGIGPWTWTCAGENGGAEITCGASVLAKASERIDGTCGKADGASAKEAPTQNLCISGLASAVSGKGPWTWTCSGANGGSPAMCMTLSSAEATPPGPAVNGLCGAANGASSIGRPTEGLCSEGRPSSIVGQGPWNWTCLGTNGGMTVSCTAPLEPPSPVDGECGSAHGISTLVKPQSGLCAAGITGKVNGKGPWTWTCSGANGGTPASCIAPVAGKSAATPSLMVPAENAPAPAPTSTKLVTPRLPSQGVLPSLDSGKAFKPTPTPSTIPEAVEVAADVAPTTPELSSSDGVQPPEVATDIAPAPALQETASYVPRIPGNHLALDPTMSTIVFTPGSSNIDKAVLPTLNKLVNVLTTNPDVRISLMSYADSKDTTPRDARRMSLKRGLAVRTYLASKGIEESRVDVHAEGTNTFSGYSDRIDVKINN